MRTPFLLAFSLSLSALYTQAQQGREELHFTLHDTAFRVGSSYRCDNIIFEPASIFIQKKSDPWLDSLAGIMLAHPGMRICISYTQWEWPAAATGNYSFDRAVFISEYLASKGIAMNRLLKKATTLKTELAAEQLNKRPPAKRYTVVFEIMPP
ncbi:MAG: hypothetical protein ACE5DN_01085 [Flavobacteriales bacterium]